jgi:hypothetical protein
MKTLTRFLVLTFILVALYLLVRNSAIYKTAIGYGANLFSRAWGALVQGKQGV